MLEYVRNAEDIPLYYLGFWKMFVVGLLCRIPSSYRRQDCFLEKIGISEHHGSEARRKDKDYSILVSLTAN